MPNEWERLRDLYHHALDLPPTEQATFLDGECTDPAMRAELDSLLRHANTELLANPAANGLRDALEAAIPNETSGSDIYEVPPARQETMIGPYHLLEKIGQGGMGEVWRAEQTHPIRRQVAVKLIKPIVLMNAGIGTHEVIARFESERQTLALMNHPAIAKVFDAGSMGNGEPYFVMEYVAGVSLTAFCDAHRHTIPQRLELFISVCEGVLHAHQKAIIHRDLKPSNILVTEVAGKPEPKIIDFGIAKAQQPSGDTMLTRLGSVLGTLDYISPEQSISSGEDIDTRSDVFALGVILYELLTGVRPIDSREVSVETFLRRLRQEEPEKPSHKIRKLDKNALALTTRERQTTPVALPKLIRGDLDSIVLKTLERDRSRRYGSASELTADIRRYLRNEPVLAVPPSLAYSAQKFAGRYRAGLTIAAAVALLLIVAAAVSIRQSVRANREAAVAEAMNDFLQNDLLAQASANTQAGSNFKPDPHLEVRTALDRATNRIKSRFARQPEVEAAIRDTIGETYLDLGLFPEAHAQLGRALELEQRVAGTDSPKTLKSMSRLGRTAYLQGQYPRAESLLSKALNAQRRVIGPDHPDTLYSMNLLAAVYDEQGKFAQAETLTLQTLEIRRRVLGPEHPDTLASMKSLADVYFDQDKYSQAMTLDSKILEIRRRVLGPEHPDTLSSIVNLASVYYSQGNYPQAETLFNQALEAQRRVLGSSHKNTLTAMANLASVYDVEGNYAKAESLNIQTFEIRRRVLGPEHPDTLMSMNNLAVVYLEEGKYTQAERLYSQTLDVRRRLLGMEHPFTLGSMSSLADIYTLQGKYPQAEALFREALAIGSRKLGPENNYTLTFLSSFAAMYLRQGNYASAENFGVEAVSKRRHVLGADDPRTMSTAADLALTYISQRKFNRSEPLAREVLEFNRKKQPDDWERFRAESLLGLSLAGQKKYAEAEPLLNEGYRGMLLRKEKIIVPDLFYLKRIGELTDRLYPAWQQSVKAAERPKQ